MKNGFLVTWWFSSSFPAVFQQLKTRLVLSYIEDVLLDFARPFCCYDPWDKTGTERMSWAPMSQSGPGHTIACLDLIDCFIGFILWVGTTRLGLLCSVWSTDLVIPRLPWPAAVWDLSCLVFRFATVTCILVLLYYRKFVNSPHDVWLRLTSWILLTLCDWGLRPVTPTTLVEEDLAQCGCHLASPWSLVPYMFYFICIFLLWNSLFIHALKNTGFVNALALYISQMNTCFARYTCFKWFPDLSNAYVLYMF